MTVPDRPSAALDRQDQTNWRSVIRIFAILVAGLGLIMIGNEILENIASCKAGSCTRIHLGTMLWGVTLLSFGMLVLQRGDVTASLRDVVASGGIVRAWFTRSGRITDPVGTVVDTVVTSPAVPPVTPAAPAADKPPEKG